MFSRHNRTIICTHRFTETVTVAVTVYTRPSQAQFRQNLSGKERK